jgi:CYTH domain-containing protein
MSDHAGKYARLELERRFLVDETPASVSRNDGWLIVDRYIIGTQLRLRRMEPFGVGEMLYQPEAPLKLTQKETIAPPDYSRMTITNIYLSPAEYDLLARLPAHELRKRRYRLEERGRSYTFDFFEEHLTGLVIAEAPYEADEARPTDLPPWASAEVSGDVRFSGGALAALMPDQAAELLREIRPA